MATEFQVTFDAADPAALAQFWAEALGYEVQGPPEGYETWDAFLDALGVPADQRNSASAIVDPDGQGPRIYFQRVPEGKTVKNRLHLDLRAAPGISDTAERLQALESESVRLTALGATAVALYEQSALDAGHIVMLDPEGNEFCLD